MCSHVICICMRVAAAAEEVVYEVVAEPQEPQGQAPQQEVRGELPKAQLTLVLSSRLKASPGAHPTILIYDSLYVSITCALRSRVVWNHSCMIPRFPGVILVCIG